MKNVWVPIPLAVASMIAFSAFAQEKDARFAAAIQDNSFLLEEAYNQEAGVVQHIQVLQRSRRNWFYSFTQEWPFGSQDHQISYTVPYSWIRDDAGQRVRGVGDAMLNYRPQIWYESATMPAFAPRMSLILPTGSSTRGTGDGSYGVQFNAAFSKIVTDRMTLHANAGMTHLFNVEDLRPTSFNVGGSAIYAVTRKFNLMLEARGDWEQSVNADRALEQEITFTISPGTRYAFDFPDLLNLQVVLGFAAPIMFTRDSSRPDFGLLFYLSFEHEFLRKK